MTDLELRELLSDAVADVEPRYALHEIRARTTTTKRRWPYAASASILAVAASVAAFTVLGIDTTPRATDPGSARSSSATASATESTTEAPPESTTEAPTETIAVYYVGDTPDGPRLYREFQTVPADDVLGGAVAAAISGQARDPDYSTGWPTKFEGTFIGAQVAGDVIRVEVGVPAVQVDIDYPAGVAEMAIEQVIYTAQAAVQERLPVQFVFQGNPVDQVLGVPTSEPLAEGPVLDTLAHVSLSTPSEAMVVDNDEPLVVEGVGNSFEGNIVTRVQRRDGAEVVDPLPTIAGWLEEKLFPFEVTLDLTQVPPGDYVVISSTDDPSGQGLSHTDSRRITIVE